MNLVYLKGGLASMTCATQRLARADAVIEASQRACLSRLQIKAWPALTCVSTSLQAMPTLLATMCSQWPPQTPAQCMAAMTKVSLSRLQIPKSLVSITMRKACVPKHTHS